MLSAMQNRTLLLGLSLLLTLPGLALAKKKAGGATATAAQARSMAELGGKFKWGMSHEEVWKTLEDTVHARYKELIEKEKDINKQDDLRKNEIQDVQKAKSSLVTFEGKKSGWDVSIIDKEFSQKNGESMIVMWEKDQRRFLFFWNGKLYKQFIAFDAEHPVFKGKTFDDFVKILQGRYGQPEMKFQQMRTKDDMVVDHMEWPAAGDYKLWAVDQSGFYGNFCLKLFSPKVQADLDKIKAERDPKRASGNALIDSVTKPDDVAGDRNADVVDQITGKKKASPQ
jgi:hypothetical protein